MAFIGGLLFVLALLVSIVLHEAGHMVCARWSGGKVTEFFAGFGPRIWSFRRGETEYGFKAIPAGGYVKIVGMTDLDEVAPEDEERAFRNKPAGKRLITLAAGSIAHFLIALVLLFLTPMLLGVQKGDLTTATIGTVQPCLSSADGTPVACNAPAARVSPAAEAHLAHGDVITAVGKVPVSDWTSLAGALHAQAPGAPVVIHYKDPAGVAHTTTVTPIKGTYPGPDGKPRTGGFVGLSAGYTQHLGPIDAAKYSGTQFWASVKATFQGLGAIPSSIPKLFTSTVNHTQRPADTPSSVVGLTELSGSIIGVAGFAGFFMFIAAINVFIGVFNLLPFPPLDGGHIAVLLFEQARKGVYRLLRRPAPGRVDLNKLMPVAYAFLLVFVSLFLLLVVADITNPIKLPS